MVDRKHCITVKRKKPQKKTGINKLARRRIRFVRTTITIATDGLSCPFYAGGRCKPDPTQEREKLALWEAKENA